ncbi:VOC family protein [Saccharomonospora xinjiangensis]|uniref:Lactoylglutathione lyase family protein n=1 Tax=Saccharomonospora xinjiangensis XJ-54 TaxID=882086 RepID=I0V1N2_9PSEU|nr:VOC family protein [Saccharomonospora xinjiangensis]EID54035.1 lactoylglutathione lyase family protein [Saccharomonospora xinjiangensis XJ-54]
MSPSIRLSCVVLDCPDPAVLARFYGELLGWQADEPRDEGRWVTLRNPEGGVHLAFQRDPDFQPPTWPSRERPQMLHLDLDVTDVETYHRRALELGATLLQDPPRDFAVYADPAGHPFCLCRIDG